MNDFWTRVTVIVLSPLVLVIHFGAGIFFGLREGFSSFGYEIRRAMKEPQDVWFNKAKIAEAKARKEFKSD